MDTNSLFLTERLNELGIIVTRKTVVGDRHTEYRDAFRQSLHRVELVIASGGLGPTSTTSRARPSPNCWAKLKMNAGVLQGIEGRFRRLGRPMAEVNKRQAMVPEGAEILENRAARRPVCGWKPTGALSCCCPDRRTN